MVAEVRDQRISVSAQSGTGLLTVFCDIASEWQGDFRPWLIEDMFPPRVAIGFGPAASFDLIGGVRAGSADTPAVPPQTYVTCYVAPSLGDLYGAAYQGLRTKRAPRDAAYHERMQNQARITATWVGPGIESEDQHFGPVVTIDRFDVTPGDLQTFNIWFETEYLPACAGVAGLRRLRRYLAMEGAARHIVMTEFSNERDLEGGAWLVLRASAQWALCRFASGSPAAYRKVIEADPV